MTNWVWSCGGHRGDGEEENDVKLFIGKVFAHYSPCLAFHSAESLKPSVITRRSSLSHRHDNHRLSPSSFLAVRAEQDFLFIYIKGNLNQRKPFCRKCTAHCNSSTEAHVQTANSSKQQSREKICQCLIIQRKKEPNKSVQSSLYDTVHTHNRLNFKKQPTGLFKWRTKPS